jgi:hypothetical protein
LSCVLCCVELSYVVCSKFKLLAQVRQVEGLWGVKSNCGFVAPPSYPSKHVDRATGNCNRGVTCIESIGAENDGDNWPVHVLTRKFPWSFPVRFSARACQVQASFHVSIHSLSYFFQLSQQIALPSFLFFSLQHSSNTTITTHLFSQPASQPA